MINSRITSYNPSNIFVRAIGLNASRDCTCRKFLKDNKYNSLMQHENMLGDFSGDNLRNCSLLGTSNVRGQVSEHIFAPNGGYCLYIKSRLGAKTFLLYSAGYVPMDGSCILYSDLCKTKLDAKNA